MSFSSSKSKSKQQAQSTSNSLNQAYPTLSTAFSPLLGQTASGTNAISSLLGLNGGQASTDAFQNFLNNSGYAFASKQGLEGVTSSDAVKGLLDSGSALKGLTDYNTGLTSKYLDNYLSQLSGLSDTGIKAGQILSSAGNTAQSQSTSYGNSTSKSTGISTG